MLVFSGSSRPDPKSTEYLSAAELAELHQAIEDKFEKNLPEGEPVVDEFQLRNAAERPGSMIMGKDAYPSFAEKAAVLFRAIIRNQPFRNSNERVAVVALWAFAAINGRKINTRYLGEKTIQTLTSMTSKGREDPVKIHRKLISTFESAIQ